MLRQLLLAFLILIPCCARPVAHDPSALIQPLIDPAKLETLGKRGANPRVQKITAILWQAKQDGHDPAKVAEKAVVIDGKQAFIGSANLTGAGLGAKGQHKRNFEAGMLTEDPGHLRELMDWIDQLYLGEFCQKCQRRSVCPDPIA